MNRYKVLAKEYILNNFKDLTRIYSRIYNNDNLNSCHVQASRILRNATFQRAMDEVMAELPIESVITKEKVLSQINKIALTSNKPADALKALELLGKYLNLWKDSPQVAVGVFNEIEKELQQRINISKVTASTNSNNNTTNES